MTARPLAVPVAVVKPWRLACWQPSSGRRVPSTLRLFGGGA